MELQMSKERAKNQNGQDKSGSQINKQTETISICEPRGGK